MEEQLITVTRLVVVLCTWVLSASPLAADQLRAGVARVDITPGESMPMYGYANRKCGPSNGTHDPLMAKVLVLEGGGTRIALVTADLGSLVSDTLRRDVAELIAHGQPLTLFGDNLLVELDLSAANLPVGSRLRVGEALVEVTPKPHNGCRKFRARFGPDALRFVQAPPTRDQNLRGIYWRVVEPGEAGVGDRIEVLSRA